MYVVSSSFSIYFVFEFIFKFFGHTKTVPQPEIELVPPVLKPGVLTSGLQGSPSFSIY